MAINVKAHVIELMINKVIDLQVMLESFLESPTFMLVHVRVSYFQAFSILASNIFDVTSVITSVR